MAILRGGTRIFGSDVRIGLSRDNSLENVETDPRLKQRAGGNPQSTIGRFQSYVNEAEGFARKSKFYMTFNLPKGVGGLGDNNNPIIGEVTTGSQAQQTEFANQLAEENVGFSTSAQLRSVEKSTQRRLQAFCKSISMPPRSMKTKEFQTFGPARKFVTGIESADITASFYCDKFMRERTYFELWQQSAFSLNSFQLNYYDDYVAPIDIYQLGAFSSRNERDEITYAVALYDCYPKNVGEISYAHETSDIQTFDVTFQYRYWINYFIDQAGQIEVGNPNFRTPTVKSGGPLGGLLNYLPTPLRRAGRDLVADLKRRIPVGELSGGRVFPPFGGGGFFPPSNI